jgi:hypothetical protein
VFNGRIDLLLEDNGGNKTVPSIADCYQNVNGIKQLEPTA